MTFTEFLTKIANSIRNKLYVEDKIKVKDFPGYINQIKTAEEIITKTITSIITKADTISTSLFESCNNLQSIDAPNVTTIGDKAFYMCSSLSHLNFGIEEDDGILHIPDKITSIRSNAFAQCHAITKLIIDGDPELGENCFALCRNLKSIIFSNTFNHLNSGCFKYLSMDSLTLGKGISYITDGVFQYSKLKEIIITYNEGICTLSSKTAFDDCTNLIKIYVPDKFVDDYKIATNWTIYASKIYPISERA